MQKEEILQKSRAENKGKEDEREQYALLKASNVCMIVALVVCLLAMITSMIWSKMFEMGMAFYMLFGAMSASRHIAIYCYLKKRSNLLIGITELLTAIACAVVIVLR